MMPPPRWSPPPVLAAAEAHVPELASEDVRIAREYLVWAADRQARGEDRSQAAYLRAQGWKANSGGISGDMESWGMTAAGPVSIASTGGSLPVYPRSAPEAGNRNAPQSGCGIYRVISTICSVCHREAPQGVGRCQRTDPRQDRRVRRRRGHCFAPLSQKG